MMSFLIEALQIKGSLISYGPRLMRWRLLV
jgi:hypothetical protein